MGRILNRYLFLEILVPFFVGLAVFTFILLIARILKLVELVVNRGVPLLDIVKTFALILPAFLEVTVPMALLLAILLGFGRLASDSEIVALKTSGVSLYQMTAPVCVFTIFATLATFLIAIWVRPWANGALRQQLFEVVKSRVSAGFKEKVFNTDFPGLVLYIEEIETGGNTLKGILISDVRRPENRSTVIAKIGLLVPNEDAKTVTLRLLDGTIYDGGGGDNRFQKTDFTVYDVSLALTNFGETRPREKDPKEMTLGELSRRVAERRLHQEPAREEEIELHRKFSIPFACVVFALVGIPLSIPPSRAVRSRGFSTSLALIFLYYIPLTVGQTLADKGFVSAAVGLWLPNLAFLALGVVLFRSAARETPLRSFDRLEVLRARLRSLFADGLRMLGTP
jgi:lipopolysaccharide export system permease protein